jgi:hypothetical protein
MNKKNLNLKKSLSPVSEQELESAAGGAGGRGTTPTRYGCCVKDGKVQQASGFVYGTYVGVSCGGRCVN